MRLAILEGGPKLCHPLARVCLGTGKKWHNIWKQHDRGGGAIFGDRGSEEKDWPGSMIEVLPRGRGRVVSICHFFLYLNKRGRADGRVLVRPLKLLNALLVRIIVNK